MNAAVWLGASSAANAIDDSVTAADAIKHGNFAGTSRLGAVVMLVGDDHEAKSSTMPYQEEQALAAAGIPVLYPASVSEFLSLGLHAVAMSRFTGCWAALKLTNPLCDGGEVVDHRIVTR